MLLEPKTRHFHIAVLLDPATHGVDAGMLLEEKTQHFNSRSCRNLPSKNLTNKFTEPRVLSLLSLPGFFPCEVVSLLGFSSE